MRHTEGLKKTRADGRRGLFSLLAPLLLLVGGLACSGENAIREVCRVNQDCGTDEQCISGTCRPRTVFGCETDEACEAGQECIDGVCSAVGPVGCTADAQCPAAQFCNTITGVCNDGRRSCTDDAPCTPIGLHCDVSSNQCVACVDASHCSGTDECVGNICQAPGTTCSADPECSPPSTVCEGNNCVAGCQSANSPVACGLGEVCDTTNGRCQAVQTNCTTDPECSPPATICESMQCIPGCNQVGGLQCTGGWVCNSGSGRCEPPAGCNMDVDCGAPAAICEQNTCVPGCAQPGGIMCGAGTVCDSGSGRCVAVQGPCQNDTECMPPNTICEQGQCIPGCNQVGGIQCAGATICNNGTGRCDPNGMICTNDSQCGPPSTICNLNNGACEPGCGTTGCTAPFTCNTATGHCYDPGQTGGTSPLNATCTVRTDCQSSACFDLGGSVGQRCVSSCGSHADCPGGFTCYEFDGAKMCISSQHFPGATFAGANGGACTEGGQCQSNLCEQNQCKSQCSENSDCSGIACQWWEYTSDNWAEVCRGPAGGGQNGANCNANSDCASGVCYGSGTCGDLCGSTDDCPNGNLCGPVNFSTCNFTVGNLCLGSWTPNFVKACVQATHGTVANGQPCTDASQCRGGFCYAPTSQCSGVCSRNADCPASMVCSPEVYGDLDGDDVYFNVCIPR